MEEIKQEKAIEINMNEAETIVGDVLGARIFDDDLSFLKTQSIINTAIKKHTATVPTYSPKNFNEQIVFYDDDTNFRLYLWINGTWRYITLT